MPRKKRSETTEARRFGVILTVLLLALAGFSFWRDHTVRAAISRLRKGGAEVTLDRRARTTTYRIVSVS